MKKGVNKLEEVLAQRWVSQGNQGRRNVKTEICSVLAVWRWEKKKKVFQVFWGLIPQLVDGKNVTALMGFGTESYLIVYL